MKQIKNTYCDKVLSKWIKISNYMAHWKRQLSFGKRQSFAALERTLKNHLLEESGVILQSAYIICIGTISKII